MKLEAVVAAIPREPDRGLEPFNWDDEAVIDYNLDFMQK